MKAKTKAATTDRRSVSHALREAILADGRTAYRLGQEAEVDEGMIRRFLDGERAPSMATIDRLALALGLRLVETAKGRGRPAKPRPVDRVEPELDDKQVPPPAPEPQPLHREELVDDQVEQPPEPAPIVGSCPSVNLKKPETIKSNEIALPPTHGHAPHASVRGACPPAPAAPASTREGPPEPAPAPVPSFLDRLRSGASTPGHS